MPANVRPNWHYWHYCFYFGFCAKHCSGLLLCWSIYDFYLTYEIYKKIWIFDKLLGTLCESLVALLQFMCHVGLLMAAMCWSSSFVLWLSVGIGGTEEWTGRLSGYNGCCPGLAKQARTGSRSAQEIDWNGSEELRRTGSGTAAQARSTGWTAERTARSGKEGERNASHTTLFVWCWQQQ